MWLRGWMDRHRKTTLTLFVGLFLVESVASVGWTHDASVRGQLAAYIVAVLTGFAIGLSIFLIETHRRRPASGYLGHPLRSSPVLTGSIFGSIVAHEIPSHGEVLLIGGAVGALLGLYVTYGRQARERRRSLVE